MKKKSLLRFRPLLFTAFVIVLLSGCQGVANAPNTPDAPNAPADVTGNEPQSEPTVFAEGYIVGMQEDRSAILVTKYIQSENGSYIDAIWFRLDENTSFKDAQNTALTLEQLQLGQQVNVYHVGPVMESYPVQANAQTVELLPAKDEILTRSDGLATAIQANVQDIEAAGKFYLAAAIQAIEYDESLEIWNVALVTPEEIATPTIAQIDAKTGKYVYMSNKAFRIFSPKPNDVVGTSFTVVGRARVFEATLQYRLEDGHNVLAEGFTTATEGGPAWGDFEIQIEYERPTSPTLVLTLYESSAEDGQPIHELLLPLQADPALLGEAP
jgi:hypothetical protein